MKIVSIDVFRGFAALAVVIHHAAQSTSAFIGNLPIGLHILNFGKYGVDFFFVLSGFIMMYIHQNDPKNKDSIKKFIYKRVMRISRLLPNRHRAFCNVFCFAGNVRS